MMNLVTVGKNTARILGREFPIDEDLKIIPHGNRQLAWKVESRFAVHPFTPTNTIGRISREVYDTHETALSESSLFKGETRIKGLLNNKEEGVKVIPGHGVFLLPSKMMTVSNKRTSLGIRVFSRTPYAKEFYDKDYEAMVKKAADHYYRHFRKLSTEINENLWYPVEYMTGKRTCQGLTIPTGVVLFSREDESVIEVRTWAGGVCVYIGTAKNKEQLKLMIEQAVDDRQKRLAEKAKYRWIEPRFIPLSRYLRNI